eukprot:TRINITY_DN8761_c0_g1_i1.p1 TRINITY_DN8761_c0_g1~~TRINITY_DN8761_c0_g1_i1.p1  ORF type:complete len:436 (-),score=114.53 TRINITY_DN8761_c0_g1_i1:114-1421(-)
MDEDYRDAELNREEQEELNKSRASKKVSRKGSQRYERPDEEDDNQQSQDMKRNGSKVLSQKSGRRDDEDEGSKRRSSRRNLERDDQELSPEEDALEGKGSKSRRSNRRDDDELEESKGRNEEMGKSKYSQKSDRYKPISQDRIENMQRQDEGPNEEPTSKGKTFLTQTKVPQPVMPWHLYDMLFPGGKPAKLCKFLDPDAKNLNLTEVMTRFKLDESLPVIVLSGARNSNRGKFLAGIARAAFRTDAVIIDSGLFTGIEMFTMRKQVKLIGVAPEGEIQYPKINPTVREPNELSNGHTHLFLLCNTDKRKYQWGDEAFLKYTIANAIATGKQSKRGTKPKCKIVYVILGDHAACDYDIYYAAKNQLPIIIVNGSSYSEKLISFMSKETEDINLEIDKEYLENSHSYILDNNNSEEIASYLHFFLTYTPYDIPRKA